MKASVLAVGTELTSGQITNRNAAWISRRLSQIGLQTEVHLTVADDRPRIAQALKFLEEKSDFIFVTGGLGPTSDDFTRELITEWAEQPLIFHENSWRKIQDRLASRGLPIGEFQKQQCQFPKNSQVLENAEGTANAFYLQKNKKHLWALPGPPNEIAAVWKDHIDSSLKILTQNLNPYLTLSWDALGLGEAVAPSLVEPLVQGLGADIGYRVHLPYLEIKFSYYKSEHEKMQSAIQNIEAALKPYTVSRNGEDVINLLKPLLSRIPHLFICDEVTQGLLLSRLQSIRHTDLTYTTDKSRPAQEIDWQIHCRSLSEFEFELELLSPEKQAWKQILSSPYSRSSQLTERRRQYFAEMALISTVQHWRDF